MIIVSLNVHGQGWKAKKLALHCFIQDHNPNIIIVQETMCANNIICNFMEKYLKGWSSMGLDSVGNSRGVIPGWHDSIALTNSFVVPLGFIIEAFVEGVHKSFKVCNIYGSYMDKLT